MITKVKWEASTSAGKKHSLFLSSSLMHVFSLGSVLVLHLRVLFAASMMSYLKCLDRLSSASRITNCSLQKLWSELSSEIFLVFPFQNHIIHFSAHNGSVWEFSFRWLNYLLIALLCVVKRFSQGLLSLPLSFKLMFVHVCVCSSSCHVFWLSNIYYTSDKYPREIM